MNRASTRLAKTELIERLGYFPAFLIPAVSSSLIYRSLIQQTLFAYINNPLPAKFKEKLFVSLSRYFGVDYFTICHSCTLYSQGCSPTEILQLETIEYPQTRAKVTADLRVLSDRWQKSTSWQDDYRIEISLLHCSNYIFLNPERTVSFSTALKRVLGTVCYHYLIVFLGYIKLCHQWVTDNPQISHQQDRRSQLYLGSLLLEEIELAQFFKTEARFSTGSETVPSQAGVHRNGSSQLFKGKLEIGTIYPRLKQTFLTTTAYLRHIPFPVMVHNRRGQVVYLNSKWMETSGYDALEISTITKWNCQTRVRRQESIELPVKSPEELCEPWVIPPHQAIEIVTALQQIVNSTSNISPDIARTKSKGDREVTDVVRREIMVSTKSGQQLYWEQYSAVLSCDRDEELTVSIAKDITHAVERENKLAEAEAKLDLILEVTKTGSWSWNSIANQVDLCPQSCVVLGLNDFDGSYTNFLQSIDPRERESIDLEAAKGIQTHQDLDLKYHRNKSEGKTSLIRARGQLQYNAEGQPIRVTGIVTEITSPIKHQQRITVQFSKDLETIINLLPYYLLIVDLKSNTISSINSGLARSLAISSSEAKGKTISECFTAEYAEQMIWQHQQVLTYQQPLHIQEKVVLPDGVHYFDTTIKPLSNDRGEIYALLRTSSDIPDLAATQEALSQRTIQLEAANRELESFSYSVSHDLQAPLRVIAGFSQVLQENYQPNLDDRGRHYLRRIEANSKRMSDLIDALLQLSRVTRTQMRSSRVNLSAIALDIIKELTAEHPERQVEIAIAPNLETKGDPQLLRIALSNLLDNAWKYTSKRSLAKIEFDVLITDEGSTTYYLSDNGAGFDRDYANKLFKAFQRLHSQAEFPGTGIGLATVQRIIFRHGGKVWAEGECDLGATIYFSL